jgi:pyrroline-5-carboxylate reductase
MPAAHGQLLLVGAGRMGAALAAGWLRRKSSGVTADTLTLVDPRPSDAARALADEFGLTVIPNVDEDRLARAETLVAAVKPALMAEILSPLDDALNQDALVISMAAGVPLRVIEAALSKRPAIRAMPNTPASIGKGISVCIANAAVGPDERRRADRLMKAVGAVEWIEDERLMDAVTAISGSGPAYLFLFCEALAAAGEAEGLPPELARTLALKTITGAAAMLDAGLGEPSELRRMVTSPGGTTQAGLDVLMGGAGLPGMVRNAVAAAERRGRQIGAASGS